MKVDAFDASNGSQKGHRRNSDHSLARPMAMSFKSSGAAAPHGDLRGWHTPEPWHEHPLFMLTIRETEAQCFIKGFASSTIDSGTMQMPPPGQWPQAEVTCSPGKGREVVLESRPVVQRKHTTSPLAAGLHHAPLNKSLQVIRPKHTYFICAGSSPGQIITGVRCTAPAKERPRSSRSIGRCSDGSASS